MLKSMWMSELDASRRLQDPKESSIGRRKGGVQEDVVNKVNEVNKQGMMCIMRWVQRRWVQRLYPESLPHRLSFSGRRAAPPHPLTTLLLVVTFNWLTFRFISGKFLVWGPLSL